MQLRKIVLPLFCAILLYSLCSCGVDTITSGYEKMISTMGSFSLTKKSDLIGVRTEGVDDYTGAYAASCEIARGRDVVFGGCSTRSRCFKITGKVEIQSGIVRISIKNGTQSDQYLIPDKYGNIEEEVNSKGGDYYLFVDYADFTGTVVLCCEEIDP